jgi:hypothetical protein
MILSYLFSGFCRPLLTALEFWGKIKRTRHIILVLREYLHLWFLHCLIWRSRYAMGWWNKCLCIELLLYMCLIQHVLPICIALKHYYIYGMFRQIFTWLQLRPLFRCHFRNSLFSSASPIWTLLSNYTRIVHTIISPAQPNLLCIQRSDMFRLSQGHPPAFPCLWTSGALQCSRNTIYVSIVLHR